MKSARKRSLAAGAALTSALVLLGLYFVWSYTATPATKAVRELPLTPHDQLLGTWFDEEGHGFIVGSHGLILRTIDGGEHWTPVASPVGDTLSSISFSDALHGVIAGGAGVILTTADGGLSWTRRNSATTQRLLKVQALDAYHDYAVGAFGTFVSSQDGGVTWRAHKLPWDHLVSRLTEEFGYIEPNLNAVAFVTPRRGWIVGEFGLVLRTDDGGETWQADNYGSNLPQLYDVAFHGDFKDGLKGWIVGQHGTLMQTGDGGRTWSKIGLATTSDLQSIAIRNGRGVAVGDGVAVWLHGDSSDAPAIVPNPQAAVLSGVAWERNSPIAVGAAGTIVPIRSSELTNTNERPSSIAVR
jgi:photosystem II stability/assembly factor-like uncharacterized protein